MSFSIKEESKGEYVNRTPLFKEMEVGESVKVTPIEILKSGTASKGDRSWQWKLYRMVINGTECTGFAPTSWMIKIFDENIGNELTLTRGLDKEKGRLIWKLDGQNPMSSPKLSLKKFTFKSDDLKDPEDGTVYSDKDAIEYLRSEGKYDDLNAYITLWTSYGSTEERAKEVFEHRGE